MAVQRFRGTCHTWRSSYGFIDCSNAQALGLSSRLYFHAGDVSGPAPSVGQPVTGTVAHNAKGEAVARAVQVSAPQVGPGTVPSQLQHPSTQTSILCYEFGWWRRQHSLTRNADTVTTAAHKFA